MAAARVASARPAGVVGSRGRCGRAGAGRGPGAARPTMRWWCGGPGRSRMQQARSKKEGGKGSQGGLGVNIEKTHAGPTNHQLRLRLCSSLNTFFFPVGSKRCSGKRTRRENAFNANSNVSPAATSFLPASPLCLLWTRVEGRPPAANLEPCTICFGEFFFPPHWWVVLKVYISHDLFSFLDWRKCFTRPISPCTELAGPQTSSSLIYGPASMQHHH